MTTDPEDRIIWRPPPLMTRVLVPRTLAGDQNGNICNPLCEHYGCANERIFATRNCVSCDEPLGFGAKYYPTDRNGVHLYFSIGSREMRTDDEVIHAICVDWDKQ